MIVRLHNDMMTHFSLLTSNMKSVALTWSASPAWSAPRSIAPPASPGAGAGPPSGITPWARSVVGSSPSRTASLSAAAIQGMTLNIEFICLDYILYLSRVRLRLRETLLDLDTTVLLISDLNSSGTEELFCSLFWESSFTSAEQLRLFIGDIAEIFSFYLLFLWHLKLSKSFSKMSQWDFRGSKNIL